MKATQPYAKSFKGKRVLVTGGLGFIGSNLARTLVALGAKVTLLDSLIPEYGGNRRNVRGLEGKLSINLSDVRDRHSLPEFLRGQHFLFNLAGQTSHMDSMSDPETDLEINCRATDAPTTQDRHRRLLFRLPADRTGTRLEAEDHDQTGARQDRGVLSKGTFPLPLNQSRKSRIQAQAARTTEYTETNP
ncbi:MAG TPA: NAD-dependent epimerase/dehydratase family protein [Lacunisphaera sp.]|nr:NAD-dependent epimerase/dehydratase family protein [Lacunisphaera sp.]